jgi:hypothetical protein
MTANAGEKMPLEWFDRFRHVWPHSGGEFMRQGYLAFTPMAVLAFQPLVVLASAISAPPICATGPADGMVRPRYRSVGREG